MPTPLAAALRETGEEIGLDQRGGRAAAALFDLYMTTLGYRIDAGGGAGRGGLRCALNMAKVDATFEGAARLPDGPE